MLYYYYRVIDVSAGWCKSKSASPSAGILYEAFCIHSLRNSCVRDAYVPLAKILFVFGIPRLHGEVTGLGCDVNVVSSTMNDKSDASEPMPR